MESGEDPDDFFLVLDGCCDLHVEMGQTVHDERYESVILQTLPAEHERVRNASYEKRDLRLVEVRHMVHTTLVDSLSQPSPSKPVAGRGVAIQAAGHANSDVWCKYCRVSETSCQTAPS